MKPTDKRTYRSNKYIEKAQLSKTCRIIVTIIWFSKPLEYPVLNAQAFRELMLAAPCAVSVIVEAAPQQFGQQNGLKHTFYGTLDLTH